MNTKKVKALNQAIIDNDHNTFADLAGEFTPNEINQLSRANTLDKNVVYMMWTHSTDWGFELTYASYLTMTDEEKQEALKEFPDMDFEVPKNFDSNIKLKNLC